MAKPTKGSGLSKEKIKILEISKLNYSDVSTIVFFVFLSKFLFYTQ